MTVWRVIWTGESGFPDWEDCGELDVAKRVRRLTGDDKAQIVRFERRETGSGGFALVPVGEWPGTENEALREAHSDEGAA